ncbi:LuxR C-terminal-related transcriptional regulator [Kitasatospora sp. NBC_00374]|uniref:LuxR C-terminal-related transcriptional regulator n=1 Tax=Kitasatospora sp. NBC_00374 TaxID=2975964 RepID=UPI003244FE27
MDPRNVLRRWPLVGREAQLSEFEEVLRDPRRAGFLVFGPAGVGKSRLAEECADLAAAAGHRVGRALATAAAASVPLGAIAHLLPAGADLSDPVAGFAEVARLLSARPAGTPRRRTVLLVDDVHLLDATSAMLLRQLMDAGVVLLLGSVRSGEADGEAVAALGHGDAVHQLDLAAFGLPQVETLLEQVLQGAVGHNTAGQLFTASGGNPLYLRELVVGAVTSGALTSDGEIWALGAERLPGTRRLTDLIRARLAVAPPAGRCVLDALALCEPLSLARLTMEAGEDTLDRLEQSGLVVVAQERRRTAVRLAHPLYGEVLRADMTALRRRETLLRHVALTEKSGARRREDALHLATHQLAATGTADPALLVHAAVLAAHAREYPRALGLLRAVPREQHGFAIRLLLGRTLYEAGDFREAEEELAAADALAADEQELLTAVLIRTQNLVWGLGAPYAQVLTVIDAARDRVRSPLGIRALAVNEASTAFAVGEFAHSLALYPDLEPDVAQAPDARLWLMAATARSAALAFLGRGEEAVDWARRVLRAHPATDADTDAYAVATHEAAHLSVLALALTECGRLAEARAVGERAYAGLADAGVYTERRLLAFHLGRGAWLAGHPARARRWFAEVARASRPHTAVALPMALAGIAGCAALQGDLDAAEAALAERDRLPGATVMPEEQLGEAWLYVARGELTRARALLAQAAEEARERGQVSFEAVLLTDLARLGQAREVADRLAEIAAGCNGPFARARAELAGALAAQDPDRLLAVAADLETIGADLPAAEAAKAAAVLFRESGRARRATATAVRAEELAARCEGARTPALLVGEEAVRLTGREQEIALLASRGMLSKDIAARLTISVRTVDNHLQRIYAKLGVTTRRELAGRFG